MLYGKEQKGPVSALTQVNGYLVSAIGQKVSLTSDTTATLPWTCTSQICIQQNSSWLFFVLLQGVDVCMTYNSQTSSLEGLLTRFFKHLPLIELN